MRPTRRRHGGGGMVAAAWWQWWKAAWGRSQSNPSRDFNYSRHHRNTYVPTSKGDLFSKDIFNLVLCILKKMNKITILTLSLYVGKLRIHFVHFFSRKIEDTLWDKTTFKTHKPNYVPLPCMHLTYLLNCAIQQIKYNFPICQKISGLIALIKVH